MHCLSIIICIVHLYNFSCAVQKVQIWVAQPKLYRWTIHEKYAEYSEKNVKTSILPSCLVRFDNTRRYGFQLMAIRYCLFCPVFGMIINYRCRACIVNDLRSFFMPTSNNTNRSEHMKRPSARFYTTVLHML